MNSSARQPGARNAALDGLRGIAILSVFFYHLLGRPAGGFIGVDVFFVLSGYLITRILLDEHDAFGSVNLLHFYGRRILRLAPALLSLLAVIGLAGIVLPSEARAKNLAECVVALFYMSNWARALDLFPMDYLAHTWSLSIEEQFYILWPATLAVLARRLGNRGRLLAVVLGTAAAGALVRVTLSFGGASPERLINGLDTRCDALLAGAALALLLSMRPGLLRAPARSAAPAQFLDAFAVLVLAAALFRADYRFMNHYRVTMPAVILSSLLLVWAAVRDRPGRLGRFLSIGPLCYVGRISYGLYIWHWPVLRVLSEGGVTGWNYTAAGIALSLGISALSFHTLESYFLAQQRRFRRAASPPPGSRGD